MLTVIGWAFVAAPVAVFSYVSGYMILNVAKEDGLVQLLVGLFTTVFLIGVGFLAVVYGTDLVSSV